MRLSLLRLLCKLSLNLMVSSPTGNKAHAMLCVRSFWFSFTIRSTLLIPRREKETDRAPTDSIEVDYTTCLRDSCGCFGKKKCSHHEDLSPLESILIE